MPQLVREGVDKCHDEMAGFLVRLIALREKRLEERSLSRPWASDDYFLGMIRLHDQINCRLQLALELTLLMLGGWRSLWLEFGLYMGRIPL